MLSINGYKLHTVTERRQREITSTIVRYVDNKICDLDHMPSLYELRCLVNNPDFYNDLDCDCTIELMMNKGNNCIKTYYNYYTRVLESKFASRLYTDDITDNAVCEGLLLDIVKAFKNVDKKYCYQFLCTCYSANDTIKRLCKETEINLSINYSVDIFSEICDKIIHFCLVKPATFLNNEFYNNFVVKFPQCNPYSIIGVDL